MVNPASDDAVYEFTPDTEFTAEKHEWRHRLCPCAHEWKHVEHHGVDGHEHFVYCKLCGMEQP